jgi:hypothetical protein
MPTPLTYRVRPARRRIALVRGVLGDLQDCRHLQVNHSCRAPGMKSLLHLMPSHVERVAAGPPATPGI